MEKVWSQMSARAYNFNAGPAALPLEVLQQAREELTDFRGIGMSIMEISHRSKEYEQVHRETQQLFRELLGVPESYHVLFLQGGASTQFAMIPMNFLEQGRTAAYVHTGSWAAKAIAEAKLFGEVKLAASTKDEGFTRVPEPNEVEVDPAAAYLHITSNETIGGIQYQRFPDSGNVPLIADMSSDMMSRPVDVGKFALIYAGAQKNLGPSGVTVVLISDELLQRAKPGLPTMFQYGVHAQNDSLYNTPPVYSIYIMNLVLKWVKAQGGLQAIREANERKSGLIYAAIDESGGFYRGVADPGSRSMMNITFRLANEELENRFVQESEQHGFVGLKGHRSVGGLRASAYNAVPYESCRALAEFMRDFARRHG
jgi:phosphoserine aminotransferase